jgi:arylsulfatase A-like enzyme
MNRLALALLLLSAQDPAPRPNVLWIVIDDLGVHFRAYGEKAVETPHFDRLAREGTLFTRAHVTAPVCSPCRSALITGMYQTSIGAHQHRSGRGVEKIRLPDGVAPLPVLFRRAGYHASNGSWPVAKAIGKTDYNFEWDPAMFDGADWSGRKPGQPFFAQIQLAGGKNRHGAAWPDRAKRALGSLVETSAVALPPTYPRDPVILDDWARYLDTVRFTDRQIGEILERLETEGVLESTLVFVVGDNGISHARGKQFLYAEGTHVALVVRGPGIARGKVRDDLVEHIAIAPASLARAGIALPKTMQARDFLAPDYVRNDAIFAARDRCDETVERLRSVRTETRLYVRNFHPRRPHLQPNRYKDNKPILIRLRELHAEGKLDALQESLLFSPERSAEELYDLSKDPWEVRNVASDPAYRTDLEALRGRLDRWMKETADRGPEAESMYDSDMAVYLAETRDAKQKAVLEANIRLMKDWARDGR